MKNKKKTFARVLCLFFVFSAFGGGLLSSDAKWGFSSYAERNRDAVLMEHSDELADIGVNDDETVDFTETEHFDSVKKEVSAEEQESESAEENSNASIKTPKMIALADETDATVVGQLKVTGGELNKDFQLEGSSLVILTSTPLTIQNADGEAISATNIRIKNGITANITLNGVLIQNTAQFDSPFNIMGSGTTCNLTLAPGSVNTLNASKLEAAAFHCGEGSELTIGGSGTLNAYAGKNSAGIGSGFNEIAGKLTFNSGTINAHAFRYATTGATAPADNTTAQYNGSSWLANHELSGGAGIGAGTFGGASEIIINGGTIHAFGSAHGAGIGASYNHSTAGSYTRQNGNSGSSTGKAMHLKCGNITINGGYITSKGYVHGGAFGASCGTTAAGCTITVTGGTLLPQASKRDDNTMNKDFNGINGTVRILGGSVSSASKNQFVSGNNETGVAYDAAGGKVFMTTINLSSDGIKNDTIVKDSWEVYIAGEKYVYGAPYCFDNGKLYLWVPQSAAGKTISVGCTYVDEAGKSHTLEPLYIENADGGGTSILKRYVDFDLPVDKYLKLLNKDYDGEPLGRYDFEVKGNAIEATDKGGSTKLLDKNDAVTVIAQRYDKENGKPLEEEKSTGTDYVMPSDAGVYKFTLISKQYANEEGFKEAYWGHRATGWATINKVPSKMSATYAVQQDLTEGSATYGKITGVQLKATVQPGDGTAATCKAPDGLVQFYINGVKVGAPVDLGNRVAANKDLTVTGNVCNVFKTLNFGSGKYPAVPELDSGEFVVTAEYVDGTNYFENSAKSKLVAWEDPSKPDDKPDTPTIDEIVEKFPFINAPVPTITKDPEDLKDELDDKVKIDGNKLVIVDSERIEPDPKNPSIDPAVDPKNPDTWPIHGFFTDRINEKVKKDTPSANDKSYFVGLINERYVFTDRAGYPLLDGNKKRIKAEAENITIYDKDGKEINLAENPIDFSKPGKYVISVTVEDPNGNKTTIDIDYNITKPMILNPDLNKDTNDDGIPDINIDKDDDGIPETNIDTDGDDKPDINIDTDGDGKPDINIDINDDGKPDINIDTNDDGKPDVNIDTNDDGKPDVNIDTDGDGKPDINKDTDGDGKPDVDIDTDGDGKPDINKDTNGEGKPDL